METQKLAYQLREVMYIMGKNKTFHMQNDCSMRKSDFMFLHGIVCMNEAKPIKMSDISAYFDITPPAVSQIIARLEKLDYVKREIMEHDRRSVYVSILENGLNKIKQVEKQMNEDMINMISFIGEEDTIELIRILQKMNNYKRKDKKTI